MFDIFKKILSIEDEKKVDEEEKKEPKAKGKPEYLDEFEEALIYIEEKIDFNEFSKTIDATSEPKNSKIIELYKERQEKLKKKYEEKKAKESNLPSTVEEVTEENALEYIENKIDNFEKPQNKSEEVSMENVLDVLDEKLENANKSEIINELFGDLNNPNSEITISENVSEEDIEKALHYFEEKAEEHEKDLKHENEVEIGAEIEEALHYLETKAEEHEKEIQEELESEIDEILQEAEFQDFDGTSFEEKAEILETCDFLASEDEDIEENIDISEATSVSEVENISEESTLTEENNIIEEQIVAEQISESENIAEESTLTEEPVIEAPTISEQIAEPEVSEEKQKSGGLFGFSFAGLKEAVSKTSEFFSSNIFSLSEGKTSIDDDLLDDMEEKFIRADIGVKTTVYIVERLRERKNQIKPDQLNQYLKDEFKEIIKSAGTNEINLRGGQLNTILITGVNGAGKTTLIGKLAYKYNLQGKKVLVAAGDTFRAAAEEQLEIWANRAGADIERQDGADPAAVVFDAIKKALTEKYDILLIDTAGRLHNKFNLMEELRKIKKVVDREAPESLVESLLVLDATTGQNGLKQAEVFKEAVNLTGVGLTKLDGTAKGGVIFGIAQELDLPVKLIGVGEKMEDLKEFNANDFIEALF